jgi:hypothetical protein
MDLSAAPRLVVHLPSKPRLSGLSSPDRLVSVGAGFSRRGRTKFGFLGGRPGPPG